ncbi:LOB domain-containing protein 38-like [Lycium barbarum]|uniref:LOB domain-containing protein 38-like n=1 Tax=Lycium barbarum TaxID=112863 RepID=UPI00293EECD2|nr:LOB domain-containing protein 38-like [Lycium barbarum]
MSCNGCRVLRKRCSENCILRPCIQWIETPEAQGHATIFVAKFFGRAGLMSFISAVPENQRPSLFQSLLYEAVGRTVNPVNGVVGLLWTGNWHICKAAVETVLRGSTLQPIPELLGKTPPIDETSECTDLRRNMRSPKMQKRCCSADLDFSLLTRGFQSQMVYDPPSRNSEESVVTTMCCADQQGKEPALLSLFT